MLFTLEFRNGTGFTFPTIELKYIQWMEAKKVVLIFKDENDFDFCFDPTSELECTNYVEFVEMLENAGLKVPSSHQV